MSLLVRALVAALLFVAGTAWVADSHSWSGPVVVVLAPSHGVHLHDWFTVLLWIAAAVLLMMPAIDGRSRALA